MHTVKLLEQALAAVQAAGYRIRRDLFVNQGGGTCTLRGQKWLFIDLAEDPAEQLDAVLETLRNEPDLDRRVLPTELANLLDLDRQRAA